jgi:phage shock protein PspC (stress-responsive transcriptional regulator)
MILLDFLLGYFSSIIPSFILTQNIKNHPEIIKFIHYIPLIFGILTIIIYMIADKIAESYDIQEYKYIIAGLLAGIIYSSIGRYFQIPNKILKINPNLFQLYALFVWTGFFYIVEHMRNSIIY